MISIKQFKNVVASAASAEIEFIWLICLYLFLEAETGIGRFINHMYMWILWKGNLSMSMYYILVFGTH